MGVLSYFLTSPIVHVTHGGECSMRGTLITSIKCVMATYRFPFDSQECSITLFSLQNESLEASVSANLVQFSLGTAEWQLLPLTVYQRAGGCAFRFERFADRGPCAGSFLRLGYRYSVVRYWCHVSLYWRRLPVKYNS